MNLRAIIIIYVAGAGWTYACTPSDSERCDGDMYYEDGECYLPDTETEDTDAEDAGTDTDTASGLGEACENQADCENFAANYCVLNPLTPDEPGICSFSDCDPENDECPDPWFCCELPETTGMPTMCLNTELSEEVAEYCL